MPRSAAGADRLRVMKIAGDDPRPHQSEDASGLLGVAALELRDEVGEPVGNRLLRDRVVHRPQLRGETVAGLLAQATAG